MICARRRTQLEKPMFWGVEVAPGTSFTVVADAPLRITDACLDGDLADVKCRSVFVRDDARLACVLTFRKNTARLALVLESDQTATFVNRTPLPLHLSGYFITVPLPQPVEDSLVVEKQLIEEKRQLPAASPRASLKLSPRPRTRKRVVIGGVEKRIEIESLVAPAAPSHAGGAQAQGVAPDGRPDEGGARRLFVSECILKM